MAAQECGRNTVDLSFSMDVGLAVLKARAIVDALVSDDPRLIDVEAASVIVRTRVFGFSPGEIAAASGRKAQAVYKQRERAERVLAAAFASGS